MLDVSSRFALAVFAFEAVCIIVLARAGHSFGTLGATVALFSLWVVSTALLYFSFYDPGWQSLLFNALFLFFPLVFIFVPMVLAANFHWLKGRIIWGLGGAAIYAWMLTPNVFSRY